jgi:hypothetical protein
MARKENVGGHVGEEPDALVELPLQGPRRPPLAAPKEPHGTFVRCPCVLSAPVRHLARLCVPCAVRVLRSLQYLEFDLPFGTLVAGAVVNVPRRARGRLRRR